MADQGRDEAFGAPVQPDGSDAVDRAGATRSHRGPGAFDAVSSSTVAEAYALTDAVDVAGSAEVIAETASGGAESVVGRWSTPGGRFARSVLAIGVFLVVLAVAWELFKWLFGDPWRYPDVLGTGHRHRALPAVPPDPGERHLAPAHLGHRLRPDHAVPAGV
jgi:hypothetical protein